jgi:hypothetical protein
LDKGSGSPIATVFGIMTVKIADPISRGNITVPSQVLLHRCIWRPVFLLTHDAAERIPCARWEADTVYWTRPRNRIAFIKKIKVNKAHTFHLPSHMELEKSFFQLDFRPSRSGCSCSIKFSVKARLRREAHFLLRLSIHRYRRSKSVSLSYRGSFSINSWSSKSNTGR